MYGSSFFSPFAKPTNFGGVFVAFKLNPFKIRIILGLLDLCRSMPQHIIMYNVIMYAAASEKYCYNQIDIYVSPSTYLHKKNVNNCAKSFGNL